MSADNIIVVFERPDGKWVGTMRFLSDHDPLGPLQPNEMLKFMVDTQAEAEDIAFGIDTEYGVSMPEDRRP
jgi:hypothetical protein